MHSGCPLEWNCSDACSSLARPSLELNCAGLSKAHSMPHKKKRKLDWTPGSDVRGVLGRGGARLSLGRQAKVLLTNGYLVLQGLSMETKKALRRKVRPVSSTRFCSVSSQILSGLLKVPTRTIENIAKSTLAIASGRNMKHAQGRPKLAPELVAGAAAADARGSGRNAKHAQGSPRLAAELAAGAAAAATSSLAHASANLDMYRGEAALASNSQGFVNAVRVTQFVGTHGLPKSLYTGILNLITASKGDVGRGPHNRGFCSLADHTAAKLLSREHVSMLWRPLAGTGRCPDVEIILDGGTIGKYYSQGRDHILVIGMNFSIPQEPYTASILVAIVNERADSRAPATLKSLEQGLAQLGPGSLESWLDRVSVSVGDNALAVGGPEAAPQLRNGALRQLWSGSRPIRDKVDDFHLINTAGKWALDSSALATQFLSLLKDLEHIFAIGHGRHIDRSVAAVLGIPYRVCKTPAGNRKMGYLCGVPERFLRKYEKNFTG